MGQGKASLLAVAKSVADTLKVQSRGTRLRIRATPNAPRATNTNGWSVVIGNLRGTKVRLEVWLDRFSGYPERKLYAGFCSTSQEDIFAIRDGVPSDLWPVREIRTEDTNNKPYTSLLRRLARVEFNAPILESYQAGWAYFGVYNSVGPNYRNINRHAFDRAVAFFLDVVRCLPDAAEDEGAEVYPRHENRKRVVSHLRRERSRLLALECKKRDHYQCQVCDLIFETIYGNIGKNYAEAHHLVPLNQLRENVPTRLEDLRTVCANCHRVLHRMAGEIDDFRRLRRIVSQRLANESSVKMRIARAKAK